MPAAAQAPDHQFLVKQPITVLGVDEVQPEAIRGGMPEGNVRVETDKPEEDQVVIELLEQHPLGLDAVGGLQQQGQQQLFRKD